MHAADWSSSSRDHQVTASGRTSRVDDEEEEECDDDDDEGEILKRVLFAGDLRPSSAAGGLGRTEDESMEDREYVTSSTGASQTEMSSSLRDKVCFTLRQHFYKVCEYVL